MGSSSALVPAPEYHGEGRGGRAGSARDRVATRPVVSRPVPRDAAPSQAVPLPLAPRLAAQPPRLIAC